MGGKKKQGGSKKGGNRNQQPDESTALLYRKYKKNCQRLSTTIPRWMVEKFNDCLTDGGDITEIHLWEQLRWNGVRALMEAMEQINYTHCKSIRLWKSEAEDQGVRAVCQFLQKNSTVKILQFLDNKVSPLGCQFLARILQPNVGTAITILKLDHNNIGSDGVIQLAAGLSMNPTLVMLSLCYCNITAEGAEGLFQIVIYQKSALKQVLLQGNHLRNQGMKELFWGLRASKSIEKVNLSDNQFGKDDELMSLITTCMLKNKVLGTYDMRYNGINDQDAKKIIEVLPDASHVHDVQLSERLSEPVYSALQEALKANKPRRGKKKGKGGKKKKGKKK